MSPPLAGLPGHPPVLWRAGGPRSPAQEIWGADFELWGPDCPLEPGVWRDRIGGLEVECVGSGDWFRDADGYVGVSKADVCYGTFPETVAAKLVPSWMAQNVWRTVAIIAAGGSATQSVAFVGANDTKLYGMTMVENAAGARRFVHRNNRLGITTQFESGARLRAAADAVPRLMSFAAKPAAGNSQSRYLAEADDSELWVSGTGVSNSMPDRPYVRGRMFRLDHSTQGVANATARDDRFLAVASAPGIADIAALRAWAQVYNAWL